MNTTLIHTNVNREPQVHGFVARHLAFNEQDGWFYAGPPSNSLVRVQVACGDYRVERRRRVTSDWLSIVTQPVSEFDEDAFEQWVAAWPLVA